MKSEKLNPWVNGNEVFIMCFVVGYYELYINQLVEDATMCRDA